MQSACSIIGLSACKSRSVDFAVNMRRLDPWLHSGTFPPTF